MEKLITLNKYLPIYLDVVFTNNWLLRLDVKNTIIYVKKNARTF